MVESIFGVLSLLFPFETKTIDCSETEFNKSPSMTPSQSDWDKLILNHNTLKY